MNSGPLSLRMKAGVPRRANSGFKAARAAPLARGTPTVTASHLPRELVLDFQQAQLALRQQPVLLEVVVPDMARPFCLTRDTAAHLWPALLRARRRLKAALALATLHALVIDGQTPARSRA